MTIDDMNIYLRMAGVDENTVTAMNNAYKLGAEWERDVACSIVFDQVQDHHAAQRIVDMIRIRE
jgi:hypothetical protein